MSSTMAQPVEILLGLIRAAGKRGLPLSFAVDRLGNQLRLQGYTDPTEAARQAIHDALENWVIDKVIDDAKSTDESPEFDQIWLLRVLDPEESRTLQELPQVERAFIKILRESEWDGDIGVIRENAALEKLREQGFDVEYVPHILGRTSTFVKNRNGERVICSHLLSEYERSDDFKAAQKDLEEIAERQAHMLDVRMDRAMREDAAREKRGAARKKAAAAKKKS